MQIVRNPLNNEQIQIRWIAKESLETFKHVSVELLDKNEKLKEKYQQTSSHCK